MRKRSSQWPIPIAYSFKGGGGKRMDFREFCRGLKEQQLPKASQKLKVCNQQASAGVLRENNPCSAVLAAAAYTEPYDKICQDKSGPEPYRRRRELLLRERQRPSVRGVGGQGPRSRCRRRCRGAAGERAPACVDDAHGHPLARLAARRRAADEVEEPGAAEREPGAAAAAAAAVREPAHRARRAAPLVVARAHQEHRVAVAVLEIWKDADQARAPITHGTKNASYRGLRLAAQRREMGLTHTQTSPTRKRCLAAHSLSAPVAPPGGTAHPIWSPTTYIAGERDVAEAARRRTALVAAKRTAKRRPAIGVRRCGSITCDDLVVAGHRARTSAGL
ncbi:hypothetical protein SEVIR_2G255366v4 [Setaria viridis]|uniref:Uncharacterized protein n=1 Tax=Setaria viridis TaxID=4556 RepID=A0A4U6VUR3_SETVI|nr:hypothetical protein SEVIR_2G255366v2 [Setaria viridis]